MIDLSPNYLATVKTILAQHVPECEVWVFGSRATWTAKDSSDLDLAVVGEGPLDWRTLGRLKESFEESDLPMRVDVLDWYGISESFREVIERAFTIVKEKARGAEAKSDWRQTTLDKLGRIVTGKTPSSRNPEYFGGGTQFVTPRDFNGRRRIESTERYLTTSGENAVKSARIPSGAVMVSCIGSDMGKSAITVEPCVTNQQINSIIVDSDFDPLFVYYDLSSRKDEIRASAGGSAQPILNKSAFGQLPITIPPLAEQQAISHVLGGLDDKIELNRRMNETLEEMARAFFKSWFVDFDPVRAKMEGRWRRGKSLPGLPADLYDLFPNRLVDSELGEVPEGWEVKTIEDIAVRVAMGPFGSSIKVSTFVESGIPVISGQHLKGTLLEDSDHRFITEDHAERLAKANVQRGDIVFTHAGNIGQVAYIPETSRYERYVISQRQFYLRCNTSEISPLFVLHFFQAQEGQHQLLANASSTGVPSIARPVTYLRSIYLCLPPPALWSTFHNIVNGFYVLVGKRAAENRALVAQRDVLLPKLVSRVVEVNGVNRWTSI